MVSVEDISNANNLSQQRRRCWLYNVEQMPYKIAWEWQRSLVAEQINNSHVDDALILLEHPPVYTLGQSASLDFIKFDLNHTKQEVHRIERGGEVTYHCPGQLVGYPILNLRYYQQDLHWYLRQLEEVLIRVLSVYGLKGYRIAGMTGVWVEDRKVAAIGIKVSKWITMHGFSLNICPDLKGFEQIIPCGIANKAVGSLEQLIPGIDFNQVRTLVAVAFAEVFNVELVESINNYQLSINNY